MKKISLGNAFSYGWNTVIANFWPLAGIVLLLIIIEGGFSYLAQDSFAISILSTVLQVVISIMLIKVLLNLGSMKKVTFEGLGEAFDVFWTFLFAQILYGLLVTVGLIFFIIPGIIFAIKYQFVPYLIIDKKMSLSEAFKASNKMASGVQPSLFLFMILSILVQFVGFICLGIGLFFTIPLVWLAMLYIYKDVYRQQINESRKPSAEVKE
jgi:uncharacterized membrane protein